MSLAPNSSRSRGRVCCSVSSWRVLVLRGCSSTPRIALLAEGSEPHVSLGLRSLLVPPRGSSWGRSSPPRGFDVVNRVCRNSPFKKSLVFFNKQGVLGALFCSSNHYLPPDPSWVLSVKLVIAVQSKDGLMYASPWQRLGKSL